MISTALSIRLSRYRPAVKVVVVPGCPYCKKTFYMMAQFIEHLTYDVLPRLFEREPGVD
jgi:hypothetical protein